MFLKVLTILVKDFSETQNWVEHLKIMFFGLSSIYRLQQRNKNQGIYNKAKPVKKLFRTIKISSLIF
jgi:hypothetical protein